MAETSVNLEQLRDLVLELGLKMATKADIADMATKSDVAGMAMRADLVGMATRLDLDRMESRLLAGMNIIERDVYSRLDQHERRLARLERTTS